MNYDLTEETIGEIRKMAYSIAHKIKVKPYDFQDVASDMVCKLLVALSNDKFDKTKRFSTWAYTVMYNEGIKQINKTYVNKNKNLSLDEVIVEEDINKRLYDILGEIEDFDKSSKRDSLLKCVLKFQPETISYLKGENILNLAKNEQDYFVIRKKIKDDLVNTSLKLKKEGLNVPTIFEITKNLLNKIDIYETRYNLPKLIHLFYALKQNPDVAKCLVNAYNKELSSTNDSTKVCIDNFVPVYNSKIFGKDTLPSKRDYQVDSFIKKVMKRFEKSLEIQESKNSALGL